MLERKKQRREAFHRQNQQKLVIVAVADKGRRKTKENFGGIMSITETRS
jgi:hypothetical protein